MRGRRKKHSTQSSKKTHAASVLSKDAKAPGKVEKGWQAAAFFRILAQVVLLLLAVLGAVVAVSATFPTTILTYVASLGLACSTTVLFTVWQSSGKTGMSRCLEMVLYACQAVFATAKVTMFAAGLYALGALTLLLQGLYVVGLVLSYLAAVVIIILCFMGMYHHGTLQPAKIVYLGIASCMVANGMIASLHRRLVSMHKTGHCSSNGSGDVPTASAAAVPAPAAPDQAQPSDLLRPRSDPAESCTTQVTDCTGENKKKQRKRKKKAAAANLKAVSEVHSPIDRTPQNSTPLDSPEDPVQPQDSPKLLSRPALEVHKTMSYSAPQHSSTVATKSHSSHETPMPPPLSSGNPSSRPSTGHNASYKRDSSSATMAATSSRHKHDQQAPHYLASVRAKAFRMAQQQELSLPTTAGNSIPTRQNKQQGLQLPPTGGLEKSFSRARQPDERPHQSAARPTRLAHAMSNSSKNVNKTSALASRINKAPSSIAGAASTNAGNKVPANIKIIASEAVLRAKAQMTQPALSSYAFGANFVTPLVGDKVGLETLMKRYSSDHPRRAELRKLGLGTHALRFYRSIRGDGNCLYRALMVRIVEAACTSQNTRFLADRLSVLHQELPQWMATPTIDYGFQLLMALVINAERLPVADLLLLCQQQMDSDSMVLFLRAITAAGFMQNVDEVLVYLEFLTDSFGLGMSEICRRFVLPLAGPPWGEFFSRREADEPHMRILSEVLNLSFRVQDITTKLTTTVFAGTKSATCCDLSFDLVYDGSHYELLYGH